MLKISSLANINVHNKVLSKTMRNKTNCKKFLSLKLTDFNAKSSQTNKLYLLFTLVVSVNVQPASAASGLLSQTWQSVKTELSNTWQSPNSELYIPIITWHNRHYYSAEEIDDFNERPWGLGYGKYRYDDDGDWHGLYAMAFLDSHGDIEPIVGYGFQKVWRASVNTRFGLGYTAGVTMRANSDYIPLPVLAPLLSVKYKHVALQSTYILGGNGYGNVLFSWLRWELP